MSFRTLVLRLPLLAGFAALTGCAIAAEPEGPVADPVSSANQAIMGGHNDSGDANVVDILWLMGTQGFSECSGSLLAPNMVLTAHHCVANIINGSQGIDCASTSFATPEPPNVFRVQTGEFLGNNYTGGHTVREVVIPPAAGNSKICGVDQAILILSDNIAPTEAVPLVPRAVSYTHLTLPTNREV